MASTMGEGILKQNPRPPIFIIDGEDVGIFSSLDDALLQLEAIDVLHGEYTAYDADGNLLELSVDGERIVAKLPQSEPCRAEQLSTALRQFLDHMGVTRATDPACDLSCLVEESKKFLYFPPRVWPFTKRGRS